MVVTIQDDFDNVCTLSNVNIGISCTKDVIHMSKQKLILVDGSITLKGIQVIGNVGKYKLEISAKHFKVEVIF